MNELIPIDFETLKVGDEVVKKDGSNGIVAFISDKKDTTRSVLVVYDCDHCYSSGWEDKCEIFQKPKPKKKLWIAVSKIPIDIGKYLYDAIHGVSNVATSLEDLKNIYSEKHHHFIEIEVPCE